MGIITNKQLVAYAKEQVKQMSVYWFGCWGQKTDAKLLSEKKRQYPDKYTATDFSKQFNRRAFDCSGLDKAPKMTPNADPNGTPKYDAKYDLSANDLYNAATEKGTIDTMPEIEGVLVFKSDSKGKKTHVGIYALNGKVLEAKGHKWGVVESNFKDTKWTHWAKDRDVDYIVEAKPVEEKPVVTPDKYMVVTAYWLNMRSTPKIANNIMCEIKGGTKLKVLGKDGSWYKVQYNGKTGYCSEKYLKDV